LSGGLKRMKQRRRQQPADLAEAVRSAEKPKPPVVHRPVVVLPVSQA
jgi:hypothetical protein